MKDNVPYDFMDTKMKQKLAKRIINQYVSDDNIANEVFELWKNTRGC
jgi:hypothetical protein